MIFCFELEAFINVGEGNQYLYLRRTVGFTVSQYTTFSTVVGVVGVVAQYVTLLVFVEKFKFRDSTIVFVDNLGCLIQTLVFIFATAVWTVYLGACFAFLDGTSHSIIRCLISKHVRPDEVGKILSFVGAIQAFIPPVASPIFGLIYRETVETLPQTYLVVLACLFCVDLAALLIIDRGVKMAQKKEAVKSNVGKEEPGVGDGLIEKEENDGPAD